MLSSLLRFSGSSRDPKRRADGRGSSESIRPRRYPSDEASQLLLRTEYDDTMDGHGRLRTEERNDMDSIVEEEEDEDEDELEEEEGEDHIDTEEELAAGHALLPIFSAAHLDVLPTYNLTHAIRLLVVSRCETTLTWDQLRSPQVSQFLLRPIQQEIRASHFSRATEYALMANCLQFNKEISLNPGSSGASKTRAMVCELLAIKLLKEFSMREMIDALSYDFDPLQGQSNPHTPVATSRAEWTAPAKSSPSRAPRISCLEVAIRAQAKRFLAHPLVVQQLEAIWAGSIVFHATADSLHRPGNNQNRFSKSKYGAVDQSYSSRSPIRLGNVTRRSVTLYDPSDASLFKLSRLRVPRYRYFLSTCSFAVLLALFLAVLIQKSLKITPLEVVFWFWSAGFILDELVGFNEQGFSLYLASFWNTFDLGILLLLIGYLCLRLYGIIMPDDSKGHIARHAYDVLAADAVLLFPRLFSVLDHYRYFSQLLIAFRMMASDLVAVFVLILVSCSGFFVALTLSFGNDAVDTPASVAYTLFQILLGFTPAAWDRWDGYNALGKTILTLFLFICHFLVVTILISVLTNSFMAIANNANEEHQFVFAVNTISMVKSDALFSYIAPTNIIAWFITPLRYFVPFYRFMRINRTIIKITHFPVLFTIFLYEKSILRSSLVEAVESIEPRGRSDAPREHGRLGLFSPQPPRRLRETSVATWQKDRALEAVFRRPLNRKVRGHTRQNSSHTVNNWMQNLGEDGVLSPPQEQDQAILDRLEGGQSLPTGSKFPRRRRDFTNMTRSAASDPEEFSGFTDILSPPQRFPAYQTRRPQGQTTEDAQHTDADGDDEFVTSDNHDEDDDDEEEEDGQTTHRHKRLSNSSIQSPLRTAFRTDYFPVKSPRRTLARSPSSSPSSPVEAQYEAGRIPEENVRTKVGDRAAQKQRHRPHLRNVSSATIIYNPVSRTADDQEVAAGKKQAQNHIPQYRGSKSIGIRTPKTGAMTPVAKSLSTTPGRKTPLRPTQPALSRARPIMPPKDSSAFMSTPNLAGLVRMDKDRRRMDPQRRSSLTIGLGSDIGDNKALGGGFVGAFPASFATQMAYATGGLRRQDHRQNDDDDRDMFGRLVLTRMNKLEEGFKEVIHEMRESRMAAAAGNTTNNNSPSRSRERGGGGVAVHGRSGNVHDRSQPMKRTRMRRDRDKSKDKERKGEGSSGPSLRRSGLAATTRAEPNTTTQQQEDEGGDDGKRRQGLAATKPAALDPEVGDHLANDGEWVDEDVSKAGKTATT